MNIWEEYCYNLGEYPEYLSKDVWQITHWDSTNNAVGDGEIGGWYDEYLRFAHPVEIEYKKSGLPYVYNKKGDEKWDMPI